MFVQYGTRLGAGAMYSRGDHESSHNYPLPFLLCITVEKLGSLED